MEDYFVLQYLGNYFLIYVYFQRTRFLIIRYTLIDWINKLKPSVLISCYFGDRFYFWSKVFSTEKKTWEIFNLQTPHKSSDINYEKGY